MSWPRPGTWGVVKGDEERIYVTMDEWQELTALTYATMRQQNAERLKLVGANNLRVSAAEQLRLHEQGCLGEMAWKIFLDPVDWNAMNLNVANEPDLAGFIDVKARPFDWHDLTAKCEEKKPLHPEWAYGVVSLERFPYCWIKGWLWGSEVLKAPVKELQPGRPTYVCNHMPLRSPVELRKIVIFERKAA